MLLLKGYNVMSAAQGQAIESVMFSGFSNLVLNDKKELNIYRKRLTKEKTEEHKRKVSIAFIALEIKDSSVEAQVVKQYLSNGIVEEIAFLHSLDVSAVEQILNTFIYNTKLDG